MEVELKLLIDKKYVSALRKHPFILMYARAEPVMQKQTSIYFDSPKNHVRNAGAGLRVRQTANSWIQTLKAGGSEVGGLHRRNEWESPVIGPEPDLTELRKMVSKKSAWGDLLRSTKVGCKIGPIFTTSVSRTIWDLDFPDRTEVEFVLDQGVIESGGKTDEISEIELELKSGDTARLFDFALELLQDIPLHIGTKSKAARGYALQLDECSGAVGAKPLLLSKKMTIGRAFEVIASNCLQQVLANEWAVVNRGDVDSLHQMRIGLRRLRSALRLFSDAYPLPPALQEQFEWLNEQTGAARDWDVLAGSTLKSIANDVSNTDEVKAVTSAALIKAEQLHAVAAEAVHSTRFTALVLSFSRWLLECGAGHPQTASARKISEKSLKEFTKDKLQEDRKRLKKRGRYLKTADARTRHKVRIAAKKMRYDAEFFYSLYSSRKTGVSAAALKKLQDRLGWMNDIAIGSGLLQELQDEYPDLANAATFLKAHLAARIADDEKKLNKFWKKIGGDSTQSN